MLAVSQAYCSAERPPVYHNGALVAREADSVSVPSSPPLAVSEVVLPAPVTLVAYLPKLRA